MVHLARKGALPCNDNHVSSGLDTLTTVGAPWNIGEVTSHPLFRLTPSTKPAGHAGTVLVEDGELMLTKVMILRYEKHISLGRFLHHIVQESEG